MKTAISLINSASVWMLVSFCIAGIFREIMDTKRLRSSTICSTKTRGVFNATITGMLIPICSCGSIPLGIGMYYSGAYLGPTLAFMTSTPMINPIAILLAFGLLGKEIAIIYVITGFVAPMIIGTVANRFGGKELFRQSDISSEKKILLETEKPSIFGKLKNGLIWSFGELTPMVAKYAVSGMLLMGLLLNIVPQTAIQRYLGDPGFISLFGVTVVAALMYVCAVGHMPLVAALVASGASPGVAVTFLMAGASTNIAELLTINRTIGKRAMFMYAGLVVVLANIAGFLTNRILSDFVPVFNFDTATRSIAAAGRLMISTPEWMKYICTCIITGFAIWSLCKYFFKRVKKVSS